jgi:hypothetical protein
MKNYVTSFGIALSLALAHAAQAQVVTPPVPTNIEVAPDQAFLLGHAFGTQNYECQPVNSLGRVGWVLFTPQATLFDDGNQQLITHFFSPNPVENSVIIRAAWQDSRTRASCGAAGSSPLSMRTSSNWRAIPWVKLESGWNPGRTHGRRHAVEDDVHPAREY